jgi:hypothetical protein
LPEFSPPLPSSYAGKIRIKIIKSSGKSGYYRRCQVAAGQNHGVAKPELGNEEE